MLSRRGRVHEDTLPELTTFLPLRVSTAAQDPPFQSGRADLRETRRRVKVIGRLPASAAACRRCGRCWTAPRAAGVGGDDPGRVRLLQGLRREVHPPRLEKVVDQTVTAAWDRQWGQRHRFSTVGGRPPTPPLVILSRPTAHRLLPGSCLTRCRQARTATLFFMNGHRTIPHRARIGACATSIPCSSPLEPGLQLLFIQDDPC